MRILPLSCKNLSPIRLLPLSRRKSGQMRMLLLQQLRSNAQVSAGQSGNLAKEITSQC